VTSCPVCAEPTSEGAQWCEACGASLDGSLGPVEGPACVDCGAAHNQIVDKYCGQCGRKQPAERDHLSKTVDGESGVVAAVTDRGKRHHRNEDAFAIGITGDSLIAVVCDGVSTTDDSDEVSLGAALAARDHLVTAADAGNSDVGAMLAGAVDAAQTFAANVPPVEGGQGAASTTFVASLVRMGEDGIVRSWTAWLGDSRAYWIHSDPDGGPVATLLTEDDVVGQSISRWLGADAPDTSPHIQEFEHDPEGWLLLCSDGLWKYTPEEQDLATVIRDLGPLEPAELSEALVAFALEQGGHDNTSVVVAKPT